eukprot:gene20928-17_t
MAAKCVLALTILASRSTASLLAPHKPESGADSSKCTTCKGPVHSWKTVPVSFHSATERTGPTGVFPESDLEIISKFPLVTIEKWQGDMFDTLMVYTGWNVDPKNTTVNTTFNKGATVSCATGHFRPAEFVEQEGRSMLLRNGSNQLVHNAYGGCHVYDHSQAATRQFWQNMCLNMTKSGVID